MGTARIRASQVHTNLDALARLGPGAAARVRARLDPATIQAIEESSRTEWLPVRVDVELTESVAAEVGDQGLYEWSRDALIASTRKPLLSPLLRGAIALFGVSPASLLRLAPRAWDAVYRDCGTLSVRSLSPNVTEVIVEGLPPDVAGSRPYLLGLGASFEIAIILGRAQGRVQLPTQVLPGGRALFVASW